MAKRRVKPSSAPLPEHLVYGMLEGSQERHILTDLRGSLCGLIPPATPGDVGGLPQGGVDIVDVRSEDVPLCEPCRRLVNDGMASPTSGDGEASTDK